MPSRSVESVSPEQAMQALRGVASAETSALLNTEVDRYKEAWRQTLQAVRETLAGLEAAVNKAHVEPNGAVSGLVDRLVAVATAAAEAAGRQVRAEARAEVGQVRATLEQVRADLQRDRDQLKATIDTLDSERTTRARVESALEQAEAKRQQIVAEYERQIEALRAELESNRAELVRLQQRIEAERAERAGLIAAIKNAVGMGELADAVAESATNAAAVEAPKPRKKERVERAATETLPQPVPQSGDADPSLVAYARELLGKAEAMYWADVSARRNASELVDRLTGNLRRARVLFARRIGATDLKETTVFEQQLADVLNNSEETSFSRHLGIAAYDSLPRSS